MSDFLAEVEARRLRGRTPGPPVAPVIIGFVAAFLATLLALPLTHETAVGLAAGAVSFGAFAIRVLAIAAAITAIVGGLLWVVFLRRSRPRWTLPVLAGLLVVTCVLGLGFSRGMGAMTEQRRQEQIARAEIVRAMDVVLADGQEGPLIDPRPKARGDIGKLEQTVKHTFSIMQTLGRAYGADIAALDISWKDGAANLTRAALLRRVERLTAAKARSEAFRTAMRAELQALPGRLEGSGVPSGLRRSLMSGLDESIDGELADLDRSIGLHQRVLDLHLAQTRFLLDRPAAWIVTGGRVTFYRAADVERFNAFAGEFEAAQKEIEELDYQSRKKMLESRDRMAGEY